MILSTLMLEYIDTLTQEHFRLIFEKLAKSELGINRYIDMGMYAHEVLKRYPGDRDWFYFLVQAMIDIYKNNHSTSVYVYRFFRLMEKKYVDNNLVMYMLKNGGEDLIHHLPLSLKQKNRISEYIYKKRMNRLLLDFEN